MKIVNFINVFFFFQAEDGIRDGHVTGVQTCALPICADRWTSNQIDGICVAKCGSLASSGLPVVVRDPATTQLFEPWAGGRRGEFLRRSRAEGCGRVPATTEGASVGRSGNRSSVASHPRRLAISARSSSLSQFPERPQAMSAAAEVQYPSWSGRSGSRSSTTYSAGFAGIASTHARTPVRYADVICRDDSSWWAAILAPARFQPTVRAHRSVDTTSSPKTVARRPLAKRSIETIWKSRSEAPTKPRART